MRLGIIIPTRNSAATIAACLEAVLKAIPLYARDVVVVDGGSVDRTQQIVRQYPVRLEVIRPGFVSRSRNLGAALVRPDVLAFVDSDCVVMPGWYDAVRECLSDRGVGVVGCRYELRSAPTWVERTWLAARGGTAPPRPQSARYVPGGNLVVVRRVFVEVGGFDETVETGEDMQLCAAIASRGYRIVECGAIRCQHLGEPRTLLDVYWRNRWHGRGARFRYQDGKIAIVTISTMAFAGALAAALLGLLASAVMHQWWPTAAVLCAPLVPAVYAARYASRLPRGAFLRLWLIYCAYFCGRSLALTEMVHRTWAAARGEPRGQLKASRRPSHRHSGTDN